MKAFKKITNKISNSKIIKNPVFLVIGLIAIILVITLIYFIFLKYSPIMNFKYEGYAISGKDITENLLGSGETDNTNTNKNIELTKIEEQGTIFKKLNDYFVGNKEKTEINLNYPIYINNNSAIYNLAESSTLISKDFEEIAGYPNLSISEGKVYDGNNLERADAKEYIFVKTANEVYINLYEIKINTTANEYTIPVNSIMAFTENSIRYYTVNNNVLVFNQINDVDNNSNVQMVENSYTYEELLTRLGILQEEATNNENNESQPNIIIENSTNSKAEENKQNEVEQDKTEETETEQEEPKNGYIKPEVTAEDFTPEVYTAKSVLTIKDSAGRIVEAPTFEIYKEGKIYLRRTYTNSGNITITGLVPDTEYEIIGKFIYLNESGQKVENTFYEGTFTTKGYEELGSIDIQKENGEIYSNKIQLIKVKITSDLNAEVIKGISQVEIETGEIRTVLKNNQVNELLQGKEITIESSEGLKSNSKINYTIKFYDKNGIELKVNNNTGETRTSKEAPVAKVSIKEQDIVSVTLRLNLTNKDNVKLENYKYVVTRPNGETVKEEKLAENEKEILLNDLDQNQYYKITIYADYDLNDNKGRQERVELGNLVFATQPISTLGSLELVVENKELTSKTSTISYKIDEERTDKRLIQILNELTINIKDGENIVKTDTLTEDEITNLQRAGTKEIKYENLKSNTTYTIEITGNVQLGNTQEEIPITYNYKEFTTLKIPAKVEIRNQFVTGNLIDFDVRIEDINNSVLNNTVRMELRNSSNDLIDLQEIATNEDYIRKTYEKLEENKTYKLSFYADQYNEGSTDATYKVNYLIKEIEIITEPGVSGSIGLTELTRKAIGKNLVDMSSETKWYVYPNFNTNDYYGKEYNAETKTLILGGHSNNRRAVYDLREYAGQEVTMSFKAKAVSGTQNAYIQNSKTDTNRTKIEGLTEEWQEFQYTLTVDDTGYLGFYIAGGQGIEIKELQIELGDQKTNYEEFKYTLQSNYSVNLEDKRDEITTNDYYVKIYEDNNLVKNDRYEEIPEDNVIVNAIKTYETQTGKQYKVELTIKIRNREYVISQLEYNTKDTEEIKGIYNKEDFLEIQPRGHYIVLGDIDLSGGTGTQYQFGNSVIYFEGTIDFNGYKLIRDAKNTNSPIIYRIEEKGSLKNLSLIIYLNNTVELSSYYGLFQSNYGTLSDIMVVLEESTNKPNIEVRLLGKYNYGIIKDFILKANVSLYCTRSSTLGVAYNYGTIKNGYAYGENIKGIYSDETRNRDIGVVLNSNTGIVKNIFSLINIDVAGKVKTETSGNILNNVNNALVTENLYSVGYGENYSLNNGPTIGYVNINDVNKLNNIYYFADITFNNKYNRKTTPLALWDTTFQNQILNSENAFDVDDLVTQGYYPQLNWPDCMPAQEYIELLEVEDKDLPDILSMEVLESTHDTAKVKFSINNPSAETITKIEIENLQCTIESQEYNDGKSEVIAILNNPIICISQYSVMKISTKGAYNQEYTREFEKNERLIDIDFYKEINTTDDWKDINKSPTENYILMQDLDFKNKPNDSVISVVFTGILDGNNHTIRNVDSPNNRYIISNIQNRIKDIFFENITINNSITMGIIANANKVENVHAKNVNLSRTEDSSGSTLGGLVGVLSNEMNNCSISNISIIDETYSTNVRIGGLIAVANASKVINCNVTNLNSITKNGEYEGVGGLIGASESQTTIKNCYVKGKIKIDGGAVGGVIGYFNVGELENSYSYVDIAGNIDNAGGIAGNISSGVKLVNNIALGNLYTSQLGKIPARIVGSGTLTNTNYAYSNQRINGLIEATTGTNIELLTAEELLTKSTYTNILNYGNAYDYSQLGENILPKLHKINEDGTYSNELLQNQEDIYLDISNEFKIDSVEIEKNAVDQIAGQIVVINTNEAEVTGIEIDGMDTTVTNIITRDGKSYINITAKPNKFYDTYKITKIKYKENGEQKEQIVEGKIEVQFYKDIYNFEDWQEIEAGTYQNYRLMSDIDFAGRTNINANVTMARLEAVEGVKTLKNIDLTFSGTENGFIKEITTKLSDVRFENIKINFESSTSNVGIIGTGRGAMYNISFKDIAIQADTSAKVGTIGFAIGNMNNIELYNVNISAESRVGGLVGDSTTGVIDNVVAKEIHITAKDYTGGVVGYTTANITNVEMENAEIEGNDYVGGIIGNVNSKATSIYGFIVRNSNIKGKDYVGGIEGYIYGYGGNSREIINSYITGTGKCIGGISGCSEGSGRSRMKVINCEIKGIGSNNNYVGGFDGYGTGTVQYSYIKNSKIESTGSYVGGFNGKSGNTDGRSVYYNYADNIEVSGYSQVGGMYGNLVNNMTISDNYINADIFTVSSNVGGIIGYLDNTDMTAVSNRSRIYRNYFVGNIDGKSNVGGFLGNIAEDLYMPEENYINNYFEAYVTGKDTSTVSLGIGGRKDQNQYLVGTYFYKYSTINGKNPNEQNEVFIPQSAYLIEADLKEKTTYTSKLKWQEAYWNFDVIENNKYPILSSTTLTDQEGIDLPKDSEHIVENVELSIKTQSELVNEQPELIFEYADKTIETYSTYSVITAENGTKATRNAKLYSKNNTLYAIPNVLSTADEGEITPVASNLILDSYNGKEYETVLGSDGKLYDLKESIEYPENFVNKDIESIGNNLNSEAKEIEVTYKNGDKIKFNYQTGEVISSSEAEEKTGLFDYLKEKIAEIGENSANGVSQEITNKYEESKELQTKLEKTSVEEAIEKQNTSELEEGIEGVTITENNVTNNSLTENKYISVYDEEIDDYLIYNEEELLDTTKEEVVSENEKIEANNLNEYYASEGETKNTEMGIVWIVISIIGVGITLFVLGKKIGIRGRS